MTLQFFSSAVQIILLNLALSGDNAVVLGMATAKLDRKTRMRAMWLGSLGVVILMTLFSLVAVYLLGKPYIQLIGGLILVWIAYKLLVESEEEREVSQHEDLFHATKTIVVADLVMSIDNVLAISAASKGNMLLLGIGLVFSVTLLIFASNWIAVLMEKYKWLMVVGAAILAFTAGDMMREDPVVSQNVSQHVLTFLPYIVTLLVVAAGFLKKFGYRRGKWR